ncbi:MAG TPA: Ig-like domain-containing protein, partial [Candidatus Acidoferrum sp.]
SVTVHIAVAPASGTGTPTGLVTLRDPSGAVLDTFTLANGSFTGSTTRLVGGTPYNVTAHYGGDGTFHSSDSAPISVTVAKENSLTAVSFVAFSSNGTPTILTGPQNIAYGSPYVLRVDVTGTAGVQCATAGVTYANPCPTGTIALTDSGAPLNDFPNAGQANATNVAHLNNQGFAEDQPVQFAPGAHIIAASYSGDASYNSSQSTTPFSITVTKAATTTAVTSSLGSITAGTSVTLTAKISSSSNGAGVTGTVQFSNGSTSLGAPVTCTPTSGAQNTSTGTAFCTATLTTAISALYPPPASGPRTPAPWLPILGALAGLLLFVLGRRWMPRQRRRAYACCGLGAFLVVAAGIAGCGGGSSGGTGGGTVRTINAVYSGDANYTGSPGSTSITVR